MKKILLTMTAVGALAIAAPAAAQYSNVNAGGTVGFSNRIAQLDARLQAGIRSGDVDRTEARNLRMELRELSRLDRQYSYNGYTQTERMDLQNRIRDLRQELRTADNGRYDRDNRYGSWNDDVYNTNTARYDRYGNRDDRNGQYDRNGNPIGATNGYYGQGGPYEPVDTYCENRGGIGGVLDNVLGRDNCTGYRVGSRVSGNLGSVPSQYRYQYRDGNGVYYRSDGRNIYQIDARTDTVIRIYSMDR
ncbi:MAG: hypothetical protein ACJ8ER_12050 [Allosphingosinicella sp.]